MALRLAPRQLPRCAARSVHIRATPATLALDGVVDLSAQTRAVPKLSGDGPFPADVAFEVLGAPYSLLSVSLPASSELFSRRGTLIGLSSSPTATSTLSHLRFPFLYHRLTSATPLTALLATNTPNTTFGVLQLDGTADWQLAQHDALLAWVGRSIAMHREHLLRRDSSLRVSGRGLVALVGRGQIYQLVLKPGEEYTVHASALLAYAAARPAQVWLPTAVGRLQVPRAPQWLARRVAALEVVKTVTGSEAWRRVAGAVWAVRSWSRRTIMGERAFLRFQGPGTILLQSRTARLRDVIERDEIRDDAIVAPGVALPTARSPTTITATKTAATTIPQETVAAAEKMAEKTVPPQMQRAPASSGSLKRAVVDQGKVVFEDSDFREFRR
ncbi:mitochondrial biogenesis AIM24-domain-containing protein [Geopyxis carbonaria]|nr:mitochondrial biogenesis AIM24-domain-containing protein [Geopyxis carbonaria]